MSNTLQAKILEAISDLGPSATNREIGQRTGNRPGEISRAISHLKAAGRLTATGYGWSRHLHLSAGPKP